MNCELCRQSISDYLEGALDDQMRQEMEVHLAQCSSCREELEALESYLKIAGDLSPIEPPADLYSHIMKGVEAERNTPMRSVDLRSVWRNNGIAIGAVAAILLFAWMVIPPEFYRAARVEGSMAYQLIKKGKGGGSSRMLPDSTDSRVQLTADLIDHYEGAILTVEADTANRLVHAITFRISRKAYPLLMDTLRHLEISTGLPDSLPWGLSSQVIATLSFPGRIFVTGDFTGDQTGDLVCYFYKGTNRGTWLMASVDEKHRFGKPHLVHFPDDMITDPASIVLAGDINGDRWDDLVVVDYGMDNRDSVRYRFWINNQEGSFIPYGHEVLYDNSLENSGVWVPLVGDFNGDGLADVAGYHRKAASDRCWLVAFNEGNQGFASWYGMKVPLSVSGYRGKFLPIAMDHDGDGLTDLMIYWQSGPRAAGWDLSLNQGDTMFAPAFQAHYAFQGDYIPFFADYNGDGLVDVLVKSGSLDELGDWYLGFNDGKNRFIFGQKVGFDEASHFPLNGIRE